MTIERRRKIHDGKKPYSPLLPLKMEEGGNVGRCVHELLVVIKCRQLTDRKEVGAPTLQPQGTELC